MNFTLRFATLKDMEQIHALIRELAIFEKAEAEHTLTLEKMTADFDRPEPRFNVLLAESDTKEILGMSFFYYAYSTWKGPFMFLEDLIVRAEHRQKGIGKKLLTETIQLAKDQEMSRIKWEVLDWNEPAITFYEKIGAQHMKEWLVYRVAFDA